MSLRAAPHQHGLVELLRWAARSRDDRLSRETCEFAARLLDSEPVPLARQPSLGFSEAAVSELDLCPSCEIAGEGAAALRERQGLALLAKAVARSQRLVPG